MLQTSEFSVLSTYLGGVAPCWDLSGVLLAREIDLPRQKTDLAHLASGFHGVPLTSSIRGSTNLWPLVQLPTGNQRFFDLGGAGLISMPKWDSPQLTAQVGLLMSKSGINFDVMTWWVNLILTSLNSVRTLQPSHYGLRWLFADPLNPFSNDQNLCF